MIRPIIDKLTQSCIDLYNPHTWNSIDEAMIPFKGRSMIKQYLPKKPVKRGIKVWVCADAVNGYVSEFQVYLGKQGNRSEKYLGERVVKDLTSVNLFKSLFQDLIYACGTLRSNRIGYPQEFKPFLKKGFPKRGNCKQNGKTTKLYLLCQRILH